MYFVFKKVISPYCHITRSYYSNIFFIKLLSIKIEMPTKIISAMFLIIFNLKNDDLIIDVDLE